MPIYKYEHIEWDERKNTSNQNKHGVTFDEAQYVFSDPDNIVKPDPEHSSAEERFTMIGKCLNLGSRIITVVFTVRGRNIRIISAQERRRDRNLYWRYNEKKEKK